MVCRTIECIVCTKNTDTRGEGKGNGHQHGVDSSPSGSNNPAAAVQQTPSGCICRLPTVPSLSSSGDLRIATVRVVLPGRIDVWA